MALETREQVLERVVAMTKPACPHCDVEMSLWEVPPINFSDGLAAIGDVARRVSGGRQPAAQLGPLVRHG